jgi:hypothetical protein
MTLRFSTTPGARSTFLEEQGEADTAEQLAAWIDEPTNRE